MTDREALHRADRLISWMEKYIGNMAPGGYADCFSDLNEHHIYMARQRHADLSHRLQDAELEYSRLAQLAAYCRRAALTEMPRCPECHAGVDRQKCFYDMGPTCPGYQRADEYGGGESIRYHLALTKEFGPVIYLPGPDDELPSSDRRKYVFPYYVRRE
jgi:hypothetical protein